MAVFDINHPQFLDAFLEGLRKRNPGEPEFHQAVYEVAQSVVPFIRENPKYQNLNILERMTEPDRVFMFRVCWNDDEGNIRINRGYRVQFNNAIGPYKGGLRFHPTVSLSVLKFLGFEQVFKNSLTTLPLGGAKGGSDFNPKGKSDGEVMRFCQAFMTELAKYIGANKDVPAGDIGVGAREIGYMYGQFKRLFSEHTGVLTGKGLTFGGSQIRKEATGFGAIYFLDNMLKQHNHDIKGKTICVSGSGNVAQHAVEKATELGGKVVTMSDSSGFIYDKDGITAEKLKFIMDLKNVRRGRINEYAEKFGAEFHAGKRPWGIKCDIVVPCATQNEISGDDAKVLVSNGLIAIAEGANMPSTAEAMDHFLENKVLFGPAKAANAGGVAVSGLEMTQNSMRLNWTPEEVDTKLKQIMNDIHEQCVTYGGGQKVEQINYVNGANIAGFVKVADALMAYGTI